MLKTTSGRRPEFRPVTLGTAATDNRIKNAFGSGQSELH